MKSDYYSITLFLLLLYMLYMLEGFAHVSEKSVRTVVKITTLMVFPLQSDIDDLQPDDILSVVFTNEMVYI